VKVLSRAEKRKGDLELLQLKAYSSLRFLKGRLLEEETTDEEDITDTVSRILAWDRILLATHVRLNDSVEI
jgi:hypothetical protein